MFQKYVQYMQQRLIRKTFLASVRGERLKLVKIRK